MPTWDEIMRTATRVEPDRRGYDGGQMFFGAPGTLQHVAGHPERAAKVFLSALDQLAGFAASWPWDFSVLGIVASSDAWWRSLRRAWTRYATCMGIWTRCPDRQAGN